MTDKNIFDIYGGLDTRESYGNESSILSYTEAKNIDIDGKVVRRARGQTQVSIAPSGSTWAGIAPAPNGFIGGINEDGKYYRTDPVTLIPTPVYTLIFYIPSNLLAVYDDSNSVVNLTWQNRNGTDTGIEVWFKIDDGEYTLLETGLSDWLGGDIPTGVTHDVSSLGYGTFYYKIRATNNNGNSEYSNESSISIEEPITESLVLCTYTANYKIDITSDSVMAISSSTSGGMIYNKDSEYLFVRGSTGYGINKYSKLDLSLLGSYVPLAPPPLTGYVTREHNVCPDISTDDYVISLVRFGQSVSPFNNQIWLRKYNKTNLSLVEEVYTGLPYTIDRVGIPVSDGANVYFPSKYGGAINIRKWAITPFSSIANVSYTGSTYIPQLFLSKNYLYIQSAGRIYRYDKDTMQYMDYSNLESFSYVVGIDDDYLYTIFGSTFQKRDINSVNNIISSKIINSHAEHIGESHYQTIMIWE